MKLRKKSVFISLVLIIVLAGSLLFIFQGSYHQQRHIEVRPGWKRITTFHGKGSMIISGQRIMLPHLWGHALECSDGAVRIVLRGRNRQMMMGKQPCSAPLLVADAPQSIEYTLTPFALSTLSITAAPRTTWEVAFVQQEKPSILHLEPGWKGIMGMGSVGGPIEGKIEPLAPVQRIWGLIGVCVGTGTISATMFPGKQLVSFPACDGQPRLLVVRYSSPTRVQWVEVRPSSRKSMLSIVVVVCVNEQYCAFT